MRKNFIAVVGWTGSVLDKYRDFNTQEEADAHILEYGGFVAPNPGGSTSYWVIDEAAKTITNDQAQTDADFLASSWDRFRAKRNALLASSDWTHYTDSPLDDDDKDDWATYRQELRDLPATTDDPADPTWPEVPK